MWGSNITSSEPASPPGMLPYARRFTTAMSTVPCLRCTHAPTIFVTAPYTRSVPTAVTGRTPKIRMRNGAIRAAPPMLVSPIRMPTPKLISTRGKFMENPSAAAPALTDTVHPPQQVGKRGVVEHGGHGVPHLPHDDAGAAALDIRAVFTGLESRLRGAGQGRKRPFHHANHRPDGDGGGRPAKMVPSAFAFFAFEQSLPFQLQKNHFQKLKRNGFFFGQSGDEHRTLSKTPAQCQDGFQTVLGAFGNGPHGAGKLYRQRLA